MIKYALNILLLNSITNQLRSQNVKTQKSEQLMCTQPSDPKNKHKPARKNSAPCVVEQINPFQLASKNIEMTKTKETHKLNLNLHKRHKYNTFAFLS